MKRNVLSPVFFTVGLVVWLATFLVGFATPERPNVVFILADDLGIECLSSYGGKSHKTPHIDKLASQGMRFTHCFSNPYCSPSRATLLTGRYPFLNGVKEVLWHEARHADIWLRPDQPSFVRQFKQAGYTTAIAGKWQLSLLHRNNTIHDFGFDSYQFWRIFTAGGEKTRCFLHPHFNQDGVIHDDIDARYGPDVNADFLIDFIKRNAAKKHPYLAYANCPAHRFPMRISTVSASHHKSSANPVIRARGPHPGQGAAAC
jgi:arylsulfatase A